MQFSEIYTAVEDIIKVSGGSKRDIAKHMVNMAYLEMLHSDDQYPLYWLRRLVDDLRAYNDLTITGITDASPPVVTVSSLPVDLDDHLITIHDVVGKTEVNGRLFLVDDSNTGAGTFELQDLTATDIAGAGYTAYESGGKAVHMGAKVSEIDTLMSLAFFELDSSTPYDPVDIVLPDKFNDDWQSNESRPDKVMLLKENQSGVEVNYLVWGPGADQDYGARYWKTIAGAILSADTDIPLLPTQYHYGIVAGAAMRLIESNVQVENAVIWPGIYSTTVGQLVDHNRRLWEISETGEAPAFL